MADRSGHGWVPGCSGGSTPPRGVGSPAGGRRPGLHVTGQGKEIEVSPPAMGNCPYVVVPMPTGWTSSGMPWSTLVVGRARYFNTGELTAVGLPAVYVPLPIGNGEQRLNVSTVGGGGGIPSTTAMTADWVCDNFPRCCGFRLTGRNGQRAAARWGSAAVTNCSPISFTARHGGCGADERHQRPLLTSGATAGGGLTTGAPPYICIAIGGAGMSAVARLLMVCGVPVQV